MNSDCGCDSCKCESNDETYVGSGEEAGRDKEFEKNVKTSRAENKDKKEEDKGWFDSVKDQVKRNLKED